MQYPIIDNTHYMDALMDFRPHRFDAAYINGHWLGSEQTFDVSNPATGELLAAVPDLSASHAESAVAAAATAFVSWSKTTASDRANLLKNLFHLLRENEQALANLLTLEQGKPLAEALGEIRYGASYVEWFAEEARRVYGDIIPGHEKGNRILVLKQPIGVVGIITPWNFPNAMIARKLAPALAAGCTVVIKPAHQTPLSALALARLCEKAGFPPGVVNIVTGTDAAAIGGVLTGSTLVRKLSFTGSTGTGKLLMAQSAPSLKRLSLELGGNAPFIVFEDADLDAAVQGAMVSKYRNAGQTCVCSNRIYVQRPVHDAFLAKLTKAVSELEVGNGLEEKTKIGPLIDQNALEKVVHLLDDALSKGAKLELGGKRHAFGGTYFEPTVLSHVDSTMRLTHEEIFGPVAPVYSFDTEAEAIALANASPYGLAAYFYGQNIHRIWRVAEALEYGMVGINTGLISTAVAPFGGVKESGFGREGSKYGIEEYLELKYLCFGD